MMIRAERTAKDLVLRTRAATSGAMKYEGRPCPRCSGKIRYVSNTHCVICKGTLKYSRAQANRMRDCRARAALAMRLGEAW